MMADSNGKSKAAASARRWRAIRVTAVFLVIILMICILQTRPAGQLLTPQSVFKMSADTRIVRTAFHLIYWTPHKTGSMSMRQWLRDISRQLHVALRPGQRYPNANFTDWSELAGFIARRPGTCSVVTGHIRIRDSRLRPDERALGAVITTFRRPLDALASKYFHRTTVKLGRDISQWADINSLTARLWFLYWNDHDPCEQLRYYDGQDGCDLATVPQRVADIARRIDCAIDMDDPGEDLSALCSVMKLPHCKEFPFVNSRSGGSAYDDIYSISHVRKAVERVARVSAILRDAFIERRCRFLKVEGKLHTDDAEPPKWPYPGCNNGTTSSSKKPVWENTFY